MQKRRVWRIGMLLAGFSFAGMGARADRIVLSPAGNALPPNDFRAEFAISPYKDNENLSWLQLAAPGGIELEAQRFDLRSDIRDRYSFNVQYPLTSDFGAVPAISLGVRDLLGTGVEHDALYVAVSRSIGLSDHQIRFVRELRLNAGAGTGSLGGLFIGVEARLRSGLSLYAEVYRHRPNVGIGLPLVRNMQAKIYSLDGDVFYGLSYTIAH